jgi:hypothetical protein
MIHTRLLGSGALSSLAVILAAAAAMPASAAVPSSRDMMVAPDASPVAVTSSAPVAALQERGRGGRRGGGGRSEGGGSVRSGGTGSWNGAQSRAASSGRSWDGRAPIRSSDSGSTAGTGSSPRASGSYDRGTARSGGEARAPASVGSYNRDQRADRLGGRPAYSGYTGGRGSEPAPPAAGYAAGGESPVGAPSPAATTWVRDAGPGRENRSDPPNRAGRDRNAASPYVREIPGSPGGLVAGGDANNAGRADRSERRGNDGRTEWTGNRRVGQPNVAQGDGQPNVVQRGRGGAENRANWSDMGRGDGRGNWSDNRRDNWRGDGRNERRGNWSDNRRGDRRDGWRGDNRGARQGAYNQGFRDGVRWDHGWRDNRRYNWIGHRQANRFLFAPGPYFAPFAGHFYRPVGLGFFLDPLFFQPRFFLNDPWAFRLPPPGARFRWVRYYDDVLLVDVFTGEVVDSIPNFFW